MTGWVGCPATETAAAVRSGTVTAVQVVSAHLDRIAKLNQIRPTLAHDHGSTWRPLDKVVSHH